MKRKISIMFTICFLIIIIFTNKNLYANSQQDTERSVQTNIVQTMLDDNKVKVEVSVTDLKNVGDGINAYVGCLKFNTEELDFKEIYSGENWNTPTYNKNNISKGTVKIVATSNQFNYDEGTLSTVIFEQKEVKENYNIEFDDFEVAAKVNGETIKIGRDTQNNEEQLNVDKNSEKGMLIYLLPILIIIVIFVLIILIRKNKIV